MWGELIPAIKGLSMLDLNLESIKSKWSSVLTFRKLCLGWHYSGNSWRRDMLLLGVSSAMLLAAQEAKSGSK